MRKNFDIHFFCYTFLKMKNKRVLIVLFTAIALSYNTKPIHEWLVYGGNKNATHFSPLNEIDTSNVTKLQPVWIYRTGDADTGTQIQVNPLIINGILYGVSPKLKLFRKNLFFSLFIPAIAMLKGQIDTMYTVVAKQNRYFWPALVCISLISLLIFLIS